MSRNALIVSLLCATPISLGLLISQQQARSQPLVNHVVYFVGTPSTPASPRVTNYLTPEQMEHWFKSHGYVYTQVASWEDVLVADDSESIDALIVDRGTIGAVDSSWIRPRYSEGLVIAAINTHMDALGSVLGDTRLSTSEDWGSKEYYSVVYGKTSGSPAALTAIAADPAMAVGGSLENLDLPTPEWADRYFTQIEYTTDDPALSPDGSNNASETFYGFISDGVSNENQ